MRTRAATIALTATIGILAVSGPALAAVPQQSAYSLAAAAAAAVDESGDRLFVRWLSVEDPRPAVRSAARSALLSSLGEAAIQKFLNVDYDAAILRAATTRQRNVDYTTRMIATHPIQYYPRVNAAGNRALYGTDDMLAYFVSTGYKIAVEADRKDTDDDEAAADKIRQDDRDFVTLLSTEDPGAQVRAWAGRAVAEGTDDDDVVEFFRHGWVTASGLDMQTFRTRLADQDQRWRVTSTRLVTEAKAAEKAAREAADEAKEQMRAAAARAWGQVSAQTGPAKVAWADAEQVSLRQAETWLLVSQAAGNATSNNWLAIGGTAQGTREEWLKEQEHAAQQASAWIALYNDAIAAEAALSTPEA